MKELRVTIIIGTINSVEEDENYVFIENFME